MKTAPTPTQRLKKILEDECWSDQRLADEIFRITEVRLHSQTLRRLMNGEHVPRRVTLQAISKFLASRTGARHEASRS